MDSGFILFAVVVLFGITMLYKLLPYRKPGDNKPFISFFPKYRTKVMLPSSVVKAESPEKVLEQILSEFGFGKKSQGVVFAKYSRGHILGDFSIKLARVNLLVTSPDSDSVELSIEAGWVIAFDTGDLWKFLTELKEKLEKEN